MKLCVERDDKKANNEKLLHVQFWCSLKYEILCANFHAIYTFVVEMETTKCNKFLHVRQ